MKNERVLLLLALALMVLSSAFGADSTPVLGILEVRGLDNLSGSVFELTTAAGRPVPREMVSLGLHGAVGAMPGLGLHPHEKVRVLWIANNTKTGGLVVLLPIENEAAEYFSSLGQTGWKSESETADKLLHFVPAQGSRVPWKEVYFLKRGATLLAGESADDVRQADVAMAALPPILPVEGDVAIQIRPVALAHAFGAQIAEKLEQALRLPAGGPPEAAALGQLYARGYLAVAQQVDECVLGLGVADGNLNIHARVTPVKNTTLAQWLASLRTPVATASVVNLPDALFAETAHLGDLSLLAPVYFRYLDALMEIMPQKMESGVWNAYRDNVKASWGQLDGDFGLAVLPPTPENPLRFAEYVALKDPAAVRALTQQMWQDANAMMKSMSGTTAAMPVRIELVPGEPREYRGIPVDPLTYRLTPGGELQAFWPHRLPNEWTFELAWIPGGMLISGGDAALTETLVDRVLDGVASPVSALPSWKTFFPTPEKSPVDLSHVALFDALRSYLKLYATAVPADAIPGGSGHLDTLSYMAMNGLMTRIRISLADIGAIAVKLQEARQKAMAAQMERVPPRLDIGAHGDFPAMDDAEDVTWRPGIAEETSAPSPAE